MKSISIASALSGDISPNTIVTINGWVRTRRDSKAGISFLNVYDGSIFHPIQVIINQDIKNYESEILHLTAGCSVTITGKLVASPGQGQSFEIQATEINVVGMVEDPDTYPISPKHHSLEYLREVAHLRPRTNTIGAVARVRHQTMMAIHQFLNSQGFHWIATPLITESDCEGSGELFRVSTLDLLNLPRDEKNNIDYSQDFFGRQTYLANSGQLNVECYSQAISKVYTFGPTFRAENSNTSRHLAEFWMVEPEIAFADLNDAANLAEQILKNVFQHVLHHCAEDMAFFEKRVEKDCINRLQLIIDSDFERMEYREAVKILQQAKKQFEFPVEFGVDLASEHERYLSEEHVGRPVIVMNYPKDIKAFYMRLNDDNETVAAMDVLAPGIGEIIGGSQREERLPQLENRMIEFGLDKTQYEWYLDLRRYGTTPHAGFGIGFDRIVNYITGLSNIRDVIAFPRTPGNAKY